VSSEPRSICDYGAAVWIGGALPASSMMDRGGIPGRTSRCATPPLLPFMMAVYHDSDRFRASESRTQRALSLPPFCLIIAGSITGGCGGGEHAGARREKRRTAAPNSGCCSILRAVRASVQKRGIERRRGVPAPHHALWDAEMRVRRACSVASVTRPSILGQFYYFIPLNLSRDRAMNM
jgi:hypothetical protein